VELAARIVSLADQSTPDKISELESILDQYTLIRVQLDRHGVGKALAGGASPRLLELGWRTFLVRVENPARVTGPLMLSGRGVMAEGDLQSSVHDSHILGNDLPETVRVGPDAQFDFDLDPSRWLGYRFGVGAAGQALEGAAVEYQLLQLYSQSGGENSAALATGLAALPRARTTECKGFTTRFSTLPASTVTFKIHEADGAGAMAALVIRDAAGRLYPGPAHRLEPDLGYQPQIYRADGETIRLPLGHYQIVASRGPECLQQQRELVVPEGGAPVTMAFDLERWIDPARLGWYAGDPHLHPEGTTFGIRSKYGLTPETMARQVRGEGLAVGSVLIWAGGYYYEKQFLTGHVYEPDYQLPFPELQRADNVALAPRRTPHDTDSILRYDAEQAAFPSNRMGHPILLRLKLHDPPGGGGIYGWPSWNLPVFQWLQAQGGVGGYAHIGNGMTMSSDELPNYEVPPMDGLGANECLVDVTHGAVDFVSGGESRPVADLNVWYHLLNCGFALPMTAETDFPVGSGGRRAGLVRTYVRLDSKPHGDDGYDSWVQGIKAGRVYFGDGRSHLLDLQVNGHRLGDGPLALPHPGKVTLTAQIAARLEETPSDAATDPLTHSYTHWHIENARLGASRKVPLEVIVNGKVVERSEVLADGKLRPVSVNVDVPRSSWIALRILPSSHTAPLVVLVGGKPVRASKRSAQWCLDCIEVLWKRSETHIRESERAAAAAAWDHARDVYRGIIGESTID